MNKALPDSITQWGILAISASPNTGRGEGFTSIPLMLKCFSKEKIALQKKKTLHEQQKPPKLVLKFVFHMCRFLCCRAVQYAGMEAFLCGPAAALLGSEERAGGDQSRDPQLWLRRYARKTQCAAHPLPVCFARQRHV